MNAAYIRMAFYVLAPLLALAPGVTYNPDAAQVVIDLEAAAIGLTVAVAGVGGVFTKWGKK